MPDLVKHFGWIPDLPDHRDFMYAAPPAQLRALPQSMDLSGQCPPVYDQGKLGSCTANAIAGAIEFDQIKERISVYVPSRLFIYYNERAMEGTVNEDSGAFIRDGIKSVAKQGECTETMWPYDVSKFRDKPEQKCYTAAKRHLVKDYQRIARNVGQMKGCLADGYPFIIGFSVYESLMTPAVDKSGDIPMPKPTEKLLGGHAVLVVGYNDAKQTFKLRNSWSDRWGEKGYGTIPYAYLLDANLSDDFWTVRFAK